MLVLTRKVQQQVVIGDQIRITIVRIKGNTVRLGIEAPRAMRVVRAELAGKSEADQVLSHPEPGACDRRGEATADSQNQPAEAPPSPLCTAAAACCYTLAST